MVNRPNHTNTWCIFILLNWSFVVWLRDNVVFLDKSSFDRFLYNAHFEIIDFVGKMCHFHSNIQPLFKFYQKFFSLHFFFIQCAFFTPRVKAHESHSNGKILCLVLTNRYGREFFLWIRYKLTSYIEDLEINPASSDLTL